MRGVSLPGGDLPHASGPEVAHCQPPDLSETVDPKAVVASIMATGASKDEAMVTLWESGNPACRAQAMDHCRKIIESAAEKNAKLSMNRTKLGEKVKDWLKMCPDLLNAVLGSMEELETYEFLDLSDQDALTAMPKKVKIGGDLDLRNCIRLTTMPSLVEVAGSLHLAGCTEIKQFPQTIRVKNSLVLDGCDQLRKLPDVLQVMGSRISMADCPRWDGRLPLSMEHGDDTRVFADGMRGSIPIALYRAQTAEREVVELRQRVGELEAIIARLAQT